MLFDAVLKPDFTLNLLRRTRQSLRGLWLTPLAVLALALSPAAAQANAAAIGADLIYANGFDMPTSGRGGANYLWYALGPDCAREDYGILPNYAEPGVRAQVQQQLAAMINNGMRRLSIGIYFTDGWHTGTVIDVSNTMKVSQVQANLATLLGDIVAADYDEVLFRFFPQATLNPSSTTFDPSLMPKYWQLVQTMRLPLVSSGMPYLIDLMVEGAPADSNSIFCFPDKSQCPAHPAWSNALRDLWRDYVAAYGAGDTVGFSFLTASRTRERVRHMPYVYDVGGTPVYPSTFAMDFYAYGGASEADEFMDMHNLMGDYGHAGAEWIISETYYNDPLAAASLSSAIAATRQPVAYLTQWPLQRAATCADVSTPPPYQFDIWQMYGF